ncbi:inter-alpha-trypsin inhibitor heavy chain H4-like isoform X3 [Periplaneta americana]|uniref:inter-alpha-trypsin inhibitor heavy chain H4-like isoform X3 n=1 Tax=Periplaneta americana TaxID=6978 RepID=UPI0037E785C9
MQVSSIVCLLVLCCSSALATTTLASTIVVPTTEHSTTHVGDGSATPSKLEIYSLHVVSDIRFRFANTVVSSRIANPANVSQEVFFSAIIPETAFISGFLIEVDGHVYKAYVKEKEEAKQEYSEAVRQGRTAAHVALSARDSNRFTVSVNVEPHKKVTFNLTYDELLKRTLGVYKNVINLDPGQIVQDLSVEVHINESADITTLNVPALRTSNEIDADPSAGVTNPLAVIERPSTSSAIVRFAPTPDQQRQLASEGIKGQLIVEYDVNRTAHSGQVLVNDGYFVHFFAPTDLKPLRKQVTFVLDISGSMSGRKIEQLRQAMTTILDDLNPGDLFSIVIFSTGVSVWDPTLKDSEIANVLNTYGRWGHEPSEADHPSVLSPTVIAVANPENIAKAKKFVEQLTAQSSTNIYDALIKGLDISKLGIANYTSVQNQSEVPQPIIIFLTDGQPNVGVSAPDAIVSGVSEANSGGVSIFCLALGNDADIEFLRKLSLRNLGFARKIYEASDTALQLRDFYRQLASPLLANVTFDYEPNQVVTDSVTRHIFRTFFSGSELVVAGRLVGDNLTGQVEGRSSSGEQIFPIHPIIFPPRPFPRPIHVNITEKEPGVLERLWVYLTIQQLLEEDKVKDHDHWDKNYTSPEKQKALELSLKYSFVTEVTSLLVVKPNETSSAETEDASQPNVPQYGGIPLPISRNFHATFLNLGASRFSHVGFAQRKFAPADASGPRYRVGISNIGAYDFLSGPLPMGPQAPVLASIGDVTWLPALSPNNTISLPVGPNGAIRELKVASSNETNTEHAACRTPHAEDGHCRHLRYCVLSEFTVSEQQFIPYFCEIHSSSEIYVGTCCPDHLQHTKK